MTIPSYLTGDRASLETVSRQQYQAVGLGDGTILCRVLGKYLVYAAADDVGITPHLCLNGCWEPWITLAIARLVQPGWYCADVGANHGYFTLIMADAVGPTGRVLAVEPNPRLADLLNRTLQVNGLQPPASVVQKAVSDTSSQLVDLVLPGNSGLNATLYRGPAEGDTVIQVETTTLDELTREWPRVDVVKIDAEGAEAAIWSGMQRVLEHNPNVTVIMEVHCERPYDPATLLHAIRQLG